MDTMQTLYVYYKVPVVQHGHWQTQVRDFQQRLRHDWPGLEVELMQRPQASPEGQETWMEVYRHPGGVSEAIMAAIARLASEMGLPPKRASEIFIPLRQ